MAIYESCFGNDLEVADEIYLNRLRIWRNKELNNCDWTQLSDSVCDKAAWAIYRKALRDLPTSNADARKIELPNAPA